MTKGSPYARYTSSVSLQHTFHNDVFDFVFCTCYRHHHISCLFNTCLADHCPFLSKQLDVHIMLYWSTPPAASLSCSFILISSNGLTAKHAPCSASLFTSAQCLLSGLTSVWAWALTTVTDQKIRLDKFLTERRKDFLCLQEDSVDDPELSVYPKLNSLCIRLEICRNLCGGICQERQKLYKDGEKNIYAHITFN